MVNNYNTPDLRESDLVPATTTGIYDVSNFSYMLSILISGKAKQEARRYIGEAVIGSFKPHTTTHDSWIDIN